MPSRRPRPTRRGSRSTPRALAIALYALVIAVPVLAGVRAQERHDDRVQLRG